MRVHRLGSFPAIVLVFVAGALACAEDDTPRGATPDVPAADAPAADAAAEADVEEPTGPVLDDGCNPLRSGGDCMLPYPSDVFLVDDPTLPTGRRVAMSPEALPTNHDGGPIDLTQPWKDDGWSHSPTLLAFFPEGVDPKHLVPYASDLTASQAPDNETLIIDTETGERVLHLSELDPRAADPSDQLLILRPQVRLANQRRYVVAIRGLTTPEGAPVAPSAAFAAVRDGTAAPGSAAHRLMTRYDADVFPLLASAGVSRQELQLAWDFTTRSQANATHDMLRIREQVLPLLEATPPAVTITEVVDDPAGTDPRVIHGTLSVPRFVTDDAAGAQLHRDATGEVVQNGMATVPFVAVVPRGLTGPVRALQFGHGFFGDLSETSGGFVRGLAVEKGFVVFGVDWWGMDATDRTVVVDNLFNHPEKTLLFAERVHQGMVNQMALTRAIGSTLAAAEELQLSVGGPAYDPKHVSFYGISQGHILGGTFRALTPTLARAVLGVGGAGFSHIMMRSSNFAPFLMILQQHALEKVEQAKFVALSQQACDRFDPITWAPHVLDAQLPNRPADVRLLLQTGLGDPQVPNMAARLHARALGIPRLGPTNETPAALPVENAPESALVEFDFGVKSPRPGDLAIPGAIPNDPVHEGVRRSPAGKAQLDAFLRPGGVITQTCEGPCDPE